jgi:caffeoyl-CoA O-methyltransferase
VVRCKEGEKRGFFFLCSLRLSRLLSQLSSLAKPRRILELGTFTGYSTLCLAEGLRHEQQQQQDPLTGNSSLREVVTIDKDLRAARIAQKYFQRFPSLKVISSSSSR